MEILRRIRHIIITVRAWIGEIKNTLQEEAPTGHESEEVKRRKNLGRDKIRAVISFDDETASSTKTEHQEQNTTQKQIRNATWAAVVAASVYALIALWQGCEMRKATQATEKAAKAAETAANVAGNTFNLTFRPRLEILSVGPYREMVNGKINNHLEGGRLRVQVGYINRGPFTAKNVRIFTYDSVGPNAVKESYNGEPQQFPQIPPSGEQASNTYLTGRTRYSATELDGLIKGTLRATFSVLIVYDDDIGKETHHAEYCDVFTLQPYNDICPWPVRND
jgi:hypothetical protein